MTSFQLLIPSLAGSTLVEGTTSKRSGGFVELDRHVGLGLPVISCYREREREREREVSSEKYPLERYPLERYPKERYPKRGIQERHTDRQTERKTEKAKTTQKHNTM